MKVLNLDKFATERRQLVLNGKSYPVEEMTVENFIVTTESAAALANASPLEQIKAAVELILRSVPTLDRSALAGRSLKQLEPIVAFVRGDEVEGADEVEVEPGK